MSKREYIKHGKDQNHPNFPHGKFSGYHAGCKCTLCNTANNDKKRIKYQTNNPKIKKITKVCRTCHKEKLLDEFYLHNVKENKWAEPSCKKCSTVLRREYRLNKDYGITIADYDRLLQQQNNRCAICDREFTKTSAPCIDHCHTTGKVRGLLHSRCNQAIGVFNDSPEICRNAALYLERGSTTISKESTLKRVEAPSSSDEDEDIVWTHSVMMSSS